MQACGAALNELGASGQCEFHEFPPGGLGGLAHCFHL